MSSFLLRLIADNRGNMSSFALIDAPASFGYLFLFMSSRMFCMAVLGLSVTSMRLVLTGGSSVGGLGLVGDWGGVEELHMQSVSS